MYELTLSDKSKKQLSKLPKHIQDRIGASFERIKFRPFHFCKKKARNPLFYSQN